MTRDSERGSALVLALMAMTLLATLGGALVMQTSTETAIAASFRDGLAAFYAAEGALEAGMASVAGAPDWQALVSSLPVSPDPAWRALAVPPPTAGMTVDVRVRLASTPGLLELSASAATPRGARRTVQATISRAGEGIRRLFWREER